MRETFQIEVPKCLVNRYGTITIEDPPFRSTVAQLEILSLIFQGQSYKAIASLRNTSEEVVRNQMDDLRSNNEQTTIHLMTLAFKLDLLNPYAIEGLKVIAKSKQKNVIR